MKMMLLAAAAALTLGSATAFAADGGDWYAPNAPVLTQQEIARTETAAIAAQRQAVVAGQRQVATRQSIGHSYMLISASPARGQQFNPNFGGGGNG